MISNYVHRRNESIICEIIGFILCFPLLNYSLPYFGKLVLGESSKIITYILFFTFIFSIVYVLILARFMVSKKKIMLIISFYLFLLFSIVLHPEIIKYVWTKVDDPENPFYSFLMYSVMTFILTDCIKDFEKLIKITLKYACVGIGLCALYYIIELNKGTELGYMTLSYNLLFPTIILILYSFIKFKLINIIFGLVGFLMIFFLGARGATVSFAVSFVLFLLFQKKIKKTTKYLLMTLMIVIVIFLLNQKSAVYLLIDALNKIGLHSRTLEKINSSLFFTDINRSKIYVSILQKSSIFPRGLYYDRLVAGGHSYAHNLLVEIVCDYGFFLGFLIITELFILIVKSFQNCGNQTSILLFSLLSAGIIRLMFSSSYLNGEMYFFILIGICMNITKEKRVNISTL